MISEDGCSENEEGLFDVLADIFVSRELVVFV